MVIQYKSRMVEHSDIFSGLLMDGVTWMSCRLVSSLTEGLAIEKQDPSHGSSRVFRVSTPA